MEIDLVSGRREMNLTELKAQEIEEQRSWGIFKRYALPINKKFANLQDLFLVVLIMYVPKYVCMEM